MVAPIRAAPYDYIEILHVGTHRQGGQCDMQTSPPQEPNLHLELQREVWQRTLTEAKLTNRNEAEPCDPCVICLDTVSEKAVAIPCRHDQFDFLCLASWLEERTQCPLCKSEVNTVHYDFSNPEEYRVYQIKPLGTVKEHTTNARSVPPQRRRRPYRTDFRRSDHRPATAEAALYRRREVYRRNLYSLHVGTNRISRFQQFTPATFVRDAEFVSRARTWIRRELQVFEYLNPQQERENSTRPLRGNNAEFLLEYCIAILKTVNIRDAGGQAEDMLQEFIGREHARLFLHELSSWLRSPYGSLDAWDRHVQYHQSLEPIPERTSSDRDDGQRLRKRRRSEDRIQYDQTTP